MEALSKYWKILQPHSPSPIAKDRLRARSHLIAEYADFASTEPIKDRNLQRLLKRELDQGSIAAALCLRCYISHTIVSAIQRIVRLYGEHYGFRLEDIIGLVLTDNGEEDIEITRQSDRQILLHRPAKYINENGDRLKPLSYSILEKFNPDKAALALWTDRLTRQNPELQKILKKEYSLLLISDWALLNATIPKALHNILVKHFNFSETGNTASPLQELKSLLIVYRKVYLRKYEIQRNKSTRCPDPTRQEYQEMITHLIPDFFTPCLNGLPELDDPKLMAAQAHEEKIEYLQKKLLEIATYIRKHRLGITLPQEANDEEKDDHSQLFLPYLKKAIVDVLQAQFTSTRISPQKRQNFIAAMELMYCKGKNQTEIAQILGLPCQESVSKLLKLKSLPIGLACHMLTHLKNDNPSIAQACSDPEKLLVVQSALHEYLQAIILEDKTWRYTVPNLRTGNSQFGQLLGEVLNENSMRSL